MASFTYLCLPVTHFLDLYVALEAAVPHPSAQDGPGQVVGGPWVFSEGGRLGILLLQTPVREDI